MHRLLFWRLPGAALKPNYSVAANWTCFGLEAPVGNVSFGDLLARKPLASD